MAKAEEKEKARQMRHQGCSIDEIADTLGVSKSSVSVWVRDIKLSSDQRAFLVERQKQFVSDLNRQGKGGSQANRQNAIKQRQMYQNEGRAHACSGDVLHEMGCMLYWAEGAKHRNRVVFVNSDPNMMRLFMRFLRECLYIPDEKVRLHLHCYTQEVIDQNRIKRYWIELLNFNSDRFTHITVMSGSNARRSRHHNGICTIDIGSTHVAMHIYGAIQEYIGVDKPEWLFEKGVTN